MLVSMPGGDDGPISETKEGNRGSSPEVPAASSAVSLVTVPFKRRFLIPTIVLAFAELFAIGYPLWIAFELGDIGAETLVRTALPVGIGASIVWMAAMTAWMLPLWAAVGARRRGERVNK